MLQQGSVQVYSVVQLEQGCDLCPIDSSTDGDDFAKIHKGELAIVYPNLRYMNIGMEMLL